MQHAFVSGVSSGIGLHLAKRLLTDNYRVYGVSRTAPAELLDDPRFAFRALDFDDSAAAAAILREFVAEQRITHLSRVFLNTGRFCSRIAPLHQIALADLESMMRINVWSHKLLFDCLLEAQVQVDCAVFSSSIAGLRARAGNSGYAISKAALNMLASLYALEHPAIRVLVIGLCNVDTHLSQTIGSLPLEGEFADIVRLRERARAANYMVSPSQRALDVLGLLEPGRIEQLPNGEFFEIRAALAPSH